MGVPNSMKSRNFLLFLVVIVGLSLLLRGVVCYQLADTPAVQNPLEVTDMATYRRLALEIRSGKWPTAFDYQPFYYAVFLPLVFLFSPRGAPWLVMVAQSLLGAAAVYLCGLCAARMFGKRWGLVAAALLAVCRFHIFYTPFMLLEVLQSFWMILILHLGMCALRCNGLWNWAALALACSCSTLTRGNALLFVPGLLALCVARQGRGNWRRGVVLCLLFVVCFYLPQLPFSLRNYKATGEWRGPSVAQNKVLALGNTPEAPPGGLEYPRSYHQWVAEADAIPPAPKTGIIKNVLKWMKREPWAFPELKFRTALLFWDSGEIPNNVSIDYHGRDSWLLQSGILLPFAVIGTLGLAGWLMLLGTMRRRTHLLLFYMVAAYWVATTAFYMLARFRIGVLPLLCVAAPAALRPSFAWILEKIRKKTKKGHKNAVAPLALLFSCYIVIFVFPQYQSVAEPAIMRAFRPNGLRLDFPGETVLYDHGPMVFGGASACELAQNTRIEKTFAIPEDLEGREACLRIWMRAQDENIRGLLLSMNGRLLPVSPVSDETEPTAWIDFRIPQLAAENGFATFSLVIPATSARPVIICIDTLRQYGRTALNGERIPAEWVAELVWKNEHP